MAAIFSDNIYLCKMAAIIPDYIYFGKMAAIISDNIFLSKMSAAFRQCATIKSCPQGLEFRERERPEILVANIIIKKFECNCDKVTACLIICYNNAKFLRRWHQSTSLGLKGHRWSNTRLFCSDL